MFARNHGGHTHTHSHTHAHTNTNTRTYTNTAAPNRARVMGDPVGRRGRIGRAGWRTWNMVWARASAVLQGSRLLRGRFAKYIVITHIVI